VRRELQALDGDGRVEPLVNAFVDDPEAPLTDDLDDAILPVDDGAA